MQDLFLVYAVCVILILVLFCAALIVALRREQAENAALRRRHNTATIALSLSTQLVEQLRATIVDLNARVDSAEAKAATTQSYRMQINPLRLQQSGAAAESSS